MARRKKTLRAGNRQYKYVRAEAIIRSRPFARGFRDYRNGIGLIEQPMREQWDYERGRQFAALYPLPLKDGKKVSHHAMISALEAFSTGILR